MTRPYEIAHKTPEQEFEPGQKKLFIFTVTNMTDGPRSMRSLVEVSEETPADWVERISPEVQSLNQGETAEVQVEATVPADAKDGEYRFTIKAVSVESPDDEWTDSSPAAIRVGVKKAEPSRGVPIWVWIVAGVVALGAIVAVVIWLIDTPPGLGEKCEGECKDGLACVEGTCLAPEGAACSADAECTTGRCKEGTCAPPLVAAGEACDEGECVEPASCIDRQEGKFCLLAVPEACESNDQCVTGFCSSGKCSPAPIGAPCTEDEGCLTRFCDPDKGLCRGRPEGMSCKTTEECEAGACLRGKCQPQGRGGACTSNGDCASGLCKGGKCELKPDGTGCSANEECASRFCNARRICARGPVGQSCTQGCYADQVCTSGKCRWVNGQRCSSADQCSSAFCRAGTCATYTGRCASSIDCKSGSSCSSGFCRLQNNQACSTHSQCLSKHCINNRCRAVVLTVESSSDRYGSDYRGFILKSPSVTDCRNKCAEDARCLAYTYVKPGVQGPEARCYLKNPAPARKANTCCTSGAKSYR